MTATDTTPIDVPEDPDHRPAEGWRGRFDEQGDDLPIDESLSRRREARALLGSLLRPYRWSVALLAIVVVVENAARLSVPILVQRGIDHGIPPIIDGGSAHTLLVIVGVLTVGSASFTVAVGVLVAVTVSLLPLVAVATTTIWEAASLA